MNQNEFEEQALILISVNPSGYRDKNWVIKYNKEDDEYFVKWTNCGTNSSHRDRAVWYRNCEFVYY